MTNFDVSTLSTNIPLNETIDIAVDLIFQHNKKLKISRKQLKDLPRFATSGTHFLFNGRYYDKIDGVDMCSQLSPVLANLFTGFHENGWITSYYEPPVMFYKSYVDDIFCIFESETEAETFLSFQ